MKRIAIVTGASAGLGTEFVVQIDRRMQLDEIWLVARRADRLEALAGRLTRARGVAVQADLGESEGVAVLRERLAAEQPDLALLVNNAGFGRYGRFEEVEREPQLEMIDLNCRALTAITYDALPYIRPGGAIIQVASLAGYVPISNHAVYAATKAYALSFGVALAGELEESSVRVLTLCPGPVATEFAEVASGGKRKKTGGSQSAERVVRVALDDLERRRWISLTTLNWKLTAFASRILTRKFLARYTNRTRRE